MKIPTDLTMKTRMHGHGEGGSYTYHMVDTEGLGVHLRTQGWTRKRPEQHTWWLAALPDQEFVAFDALREAAEAVKPEQAAAEAAKWPKVEVKPEGASLNNRCRLCPRDPHVRATQRVLVRESWISLDWTHSAGLCDFHALMTQSPPSLIAALEEEVRERKALAKPLLAATTPKDRHEQ